ncbi:MAG: hypothetical protein JAY71_19335 [Candidatus Thiodiazotropha weberae]|nr:hypothetical protein [Candidatus Thiodiazotropha weberae]
MSRQAEQGTRVSDLGDYRLHERYPPELLGKLTELGLWLRGKFDEVSKARQSVEERWLQDWRQYRGLYEPPELKRLEDSQRRSRTFCKMTRKKVKAFDSRMMDMLFPAGKDRNWDIKPTPKPEGVMGPVAQRMVAQRQQQMFMEQAQQLSQESGQPVEAVVKRLQLGGFTPEISGDELRLIQLSSAKAGCDRMVIEIADQLSQLRYKQVCRQVVHSGHLYGTGIIKGPLSQYVQVPKWLPPGQGVDPGGRSAQWTMEMVNRLSPFLEFVPLWSWYPDSSARELSQMEFSFQRHVMLKGQVLGLLDRPSFDGEVVRRYLEEFPDGDAQMMGWETRLDGGDERNDGQEERVSRRYEVLEFWGVLNDSQLKDLGLDALASGSMWVNCWVLGDFVIRSGQRPLEGQDHPYSVYYHDKDEASIWGDGVPLIMRDDQEALNAVVRAMMDNVATTVGPQWDVNTDLLKPGERTREIYPNRIWYRRGDSRQPAIRAVESSSRLQEFLSLKGTFEQQIHESTLPAYMQGGQAGGAGRTATGLSMLMGSANMDIKEQVMSFDLGITRPVLRGFYLWNMQFSQDDSIKGDYEVVARGSSSLVAKELRAQQLDQMLPMLMQPPFVSHVDIRKLLEEVFKVRDLLDSEILLSEREFDERQQMSQRIEQLQGQVQQGMALIEQLRRIAPTLLRQAMDRVSMPGQMGA